MSFRSVILGLLFGLAICVATYFNDAVIHQTKLIGNFFPVSVFGVLVVALLAVNPLLGVARLTGKEMALIAAIGLTACGWPGSGFFRTANTSVGMPGYLIRNNAAWQAANVMSYVPGGAAELGEGHVADWMGLAETLVTAAKTTDSSSSPDAAIDPDGATARLHLLWKQLPTDVHSILPQAIARGRMDPVERQRLLSSLNKVITNGQFWQRPMIREAIAPDQREALLEQRDTIEHQQQVAQEHLQAIREQLASVRAQLEPDRLSLEQNREAAETKRQQIEDERTQLLAQRDTVQRDIARLEVEQRQARSSAENPSPPTSGDGEDFESRIKTRRADLERVQIALAELNRTLRQTRRQLNQVGRQLQRVDRPADKLRDEALLTDLKLEQLADSADTVRRELNRAALVSLLPKHLAPMPEGSGWLLRGGDADSLAVGIMQQGWEGKRTLGPSQLPWESWKPVLKLWVPLVLLMAVGVVCLCLVVHPQWAERELLPYPIARFVQELVHSSHGRRLPDVAYSRLFWLGLLVVLAIHVLNGLNRWELTFVGLPLTYDFLAVRTLFENASKAPQAWAVFLPTVYFAVIGFAFFLRTEVSLSLGLVGVAYMVLGSLLYGYGVPIDHNNLTPGNHSLILFGAWLGGALMIFYTGRRYYLSVLGSILGLPRGIDVPHYAVWAARGLVLCVFGAVWVLTQGGLDWTLSLVLVAMLLMMFLVLARISTETGAFFIQPSWLPVGVLVGLLGEKAMGPTAYFLVAITSVVLAVDPREALMPFVANALQIGKQADAPPRRSIGPILLMVILSFGAAGLTTMLFQYNKGIDITDKWAVVDVPNMAPASTTTLISELSARQELTAATQLNGIERLNAIRPQKGALGWVSTGLLLVLVCAWARLRFAWWPLHPVIFMVFGSVAAMRFAASFFIGWAIKASVVRLGGSRSYHLVQPLMIGLIAGEILAVLVWTVAGAVYYWVTNTAPPRYDIFPI